MQVRESDLKVQDDTQKTNDVQEQELPPSHTHTENGMQIL